MIDIDVDQQLFQYTRFGYALDAKERQLAG